MKSTIVFLIFLLVFWIGASSYCYVCEIRKDCCTGNDGNRSFGVNSTMGSVRPDSSAKAIVSEVSPVPEKVVVYFAPGKSKSILNQKELDYIGTIKKYLMTKADSRIMITGHADISGSFVDNSRISMGRAEFIKQLLIDSGFQAGTIDISGKGALEPASDNASAEGRAKNRRVEIQIH